MSEMPKPLDEQEPAHEDLRVSRTMLQKKAQAEHQARRKQDVREYASFVPRNAVIKVGSWPKL